MLENIFCMCVFLTKNSYLSTSDNLVLMKNSFLTIAYLVCVYGSRSLNSYITFNWNSWWQSNYLFFESMAFGDTDFQSLISLRV